MLTNEQRAHDIAILQLQINVPTIQQKVSKDALKEGNFNLLGLYLNFYNSALTALEKPSNGQ